MLHSTERIKRGNTGRKICNLGRKGLWGGRGRNLSDRMVSLYAMGENKLKIWDKTTLIED
jgi:hypothetical protein